MANHKPKGVEWMRRIGKLGGIASGKVRLDRVPPAKRHENAVKAARTRWDKAKK